MKTKNVSSYKTEIDRQFVENRAMKIQMLNDSFYEKRQSKRVPADIFPKPGK